MAIYGVALLAFCTIAGMVLGELLGWMMQVKANVGGVGIAMLLLIGLTESLRSRGKLPMPTQQGILFWSAIYIPIVVAMAAGQDVYRTLKSGPMAMFAGCLVTAICFALVPLVDRLCPVTSKAVSADDQATNSEKS